MHYEESREELKKKNKVSPILMELEAHEQADLSPAFRYNQPLFQTPNKPGFFDLSSHARARAAMDFAFKMRGKQFHVVVIGEDRSGRISSTLTYLEAQAKKMKRPCDWVYLNNFFQTYKPLPYPLPHGMGQYLKEQLSLFITNVNTFINQLLNSPSYLNIVETLGAQMQFEIDAGYRSLMREAEEHGFRLEQTEQGLNILPLDEGNNFSVTGLAALREKLTKATLAANFAQQNMDSKISHFRKENLQKALEPLFEDFRLKFEPYLKSWISSLEEDILSNLDLFLNVEEIGSPSENSQIKERYAVNLFINNTDVKHPKVILVNNPTYDNIFGSIQYVTNGQSGMIETNFTMIKPGALHHANGGFLMIRAENLAQDPDLWQALKSALRDHLIRIQEKHRDNTFPILDAPKPHAIPLDVQVFLITSPTTYYSFLQYDQDFSAYFKIKAEIDSDMPRTRENIKAYHSLLTYCAKRHHGQSISPAALNMLVDYASRKTGSTKKLTAQFELILDILDQAAALKLYSKRLNVHSIKKIQKLIEYRHSRFEEEIYDQILSQTLFIETEGARIGQINGLTVLTMGDHEFGIPSRITAQTYISNEGITNIERLTEMAGPIQQKGIFILEGYLKSLFAQDFPLSCGCSITFEQAYSDIDGDSASLAELISILSSLSGYPIIQNIAVTGAMDQFGNVQAVGGISSKVEGFFKVCKQKGLTGKQGVIIPRSNKDSLTLKKDVRDHIDQGKFKVYFVSTVTEAINILFGCDIKTDNNIVGKDLLKEVVFREAYAKLKRYNAALKKDK